MSGKYGYLLFGMMALWAGCSVLNKGSECHGRIPQGYSCCGRQVVPNYQCCNTVVMTSDQICCAGMKVADLKTEICCRGEVYPRESVECCERTPSPRGTCSRVK